MPRELLPFLLCLLIPLTVGVAYFDIKHRRIPNRLVLVAFFSGLIANSISSGWRGLGDSILGCLLGFGLMLSLHLFGALGAGDVKLFAAISSIIGVGVVVKTFIIVVLVGALLAIGSMVYTRTAQVTLQRVLMILVGFLPGWKIPRYEVTSDRHTLPYGVAITLGTLISLVFFPL